MNPFEFTPALETGNRDIDAHVRTLFAIANEILYSKALEESPREFRRALKFFIVYLDYHFASEEIVMAQRHYPSRHLHSDFHSQVLREAAAIERRVNAKGASEESRDALYFMVEDWLVYHVVEADRQFATFLREAPAAETIARLPGIRDLKASGALSPEFDEQMMERVAALGYLECLPRIAPANEATRS
jgi:hemerythrin-like metal-binding protein